jgi:hypothetical protein
MRAWLAVLIVVAACGGRQLAEDTRSQEILNLWTQIRDWRQEAMWKPDPPPEAFAQVVNRTVKEVARVCPEGTPQPPTCHDVCNLADAICDNAERICDIAADLGTGWAKDKCTSAKASCRDAKQRCCDKCSPPKATLQWNTTPSP